ncbi:MAG: response regulator, partial [Edaphobacter sp.]
LRVNLLTHPPGVPANQQMHRKGRSAASHPKAASEQKRDRMRPKKTILCVDDNEQVLSVRTFLLETRGYRIIAANTAKEALEVLERSLPGTLDLVLCDLLMPQMDGNELVRRAKQLHPGLPAMIISGTVNAFDRALHADVFLPKGASSPAEMIERIRVLVARKRGPKKGAAPASAQPADTPSFAHATAS